ncbi:hypothetical protein ACFL5Z_17140 [Planctomycetota bacterium]
MREKAMPALVIAVVAAFFTVWFSLKKESIKTDFTSSIFINISDKNPLDLHEDRHLLYGGDQFDGKLQSYIRNALSARDDLTADANNVSEQAIEFYMDMMIVEIVSRFFWMYADWWDVHIQSVRRGTSTSTGLSANKPDPPFIPIKWSDWLASLDSSSTLYPLLKEYSDDYWIQKMVVPPQTKVHLTSERYMRRILFENKFVKLCIAFRRRTAGRGLGDYQLLLGYDNKRNNTYWSEHLEVKCHADFNKLRSGHPEMGRYMRWVKTMFAELEYRLDDKQRLERALEYKSLLKLTQR